MAHVQADNFHITDVNANVVQQGTGNAGRDIVHHHLSQTTLTNPSPSSTVPFRRDKDFVHCDNLDILSKLCDEQASRVALVGLGGVGKSQIAIQYSYQLRDISPTTWVFWVHASTTARFEESYRRIAETTKLEGWNDSEADILRLVRVWLCDESNGRWLMIIDNADDSRVFFPPEKKQGDATDESICPPEPLANFVPQSSNGAVLITSRNRDVALRFTGSDEYIISVNPMDQAQALTLLQKKLRDKYEPEKATALVEALDFMPLAITQAAAYIRIASRTTLSTYLQKLGENDEQRANLLKKDVGDIRRDVPRDGKASNSILVTWQVSFEYIRQEKPSAAELLSLMCLFDRQRIPCSILECAYEETNDQNLDDDLDVLANFSLITIEVDGTCFGMHRLVQFATRKWLDLLEELEYWKEEYAFLMESQYPVGKFENWVKCRALFPHVQAAIAMRPKEMEALESWASVLCSAAFYAEETGNHSMAEEMNRLSLEAREIARGPEHPDTLVSMNNLALVIASQGRLDEAEELAVKALETRKRVLELDDEETLSSIGNLANILSKQGRSKEAEKLEKEALAAKKRILGLEHPSTLITMANLATTMHDQGRFHEAEELELEVLIIKQRVLGPEHLSTLVTMANLASTLQDQGRLNVAEFLKIEVLTISERVLGPEHPDTIMRMANLATLLHQQGQLKRGQELEAKALGMSERVLGLEHPDTLITMHNHACTLRAQGHEEEAVSLLRKCLQLQRNVLGAEHPETESSQQDLNIMETGT